MDFHDDDGNYDGNYTPGKLAKDATLATLAYLALVALGAVALIAFFNILFIIL